VTPNIPTPIRPLKVSEPQNVLSVSLQYCADGQESGIATSFAGFGPFGALPTSSAVVHSVKVEPFDEYEIAMPLASRPGSVFEP
jgi:hypothetical protein